MSPSYDVNESARLCVCVCVCVCVCLRAKANLAETSMQTGLFGLARFVQPPLIFLVSVYLTHSLSTHHISLPSSRLFPCVSKPCLLEGLWISDELILRWIIVMVYSARVLLFCRCECRTVRSDLLWRPSEFASSILCTCPHMAAETRARTLT